MLLMVVVDDKTGRLTRVRYVWEPGVSPEEDAKMDRILELVHQCTDDINNWLFMEDYERGIYRIFKDENRMVVNGSGMLVKFCFGDYEETIQEKWWKRNKSAITLERV